MQQENELIEQLIPAVEQQIESPTTPFVNKHFKRMVNLGESEFEAKKMIALCLTDETNRMYIDKRSFNISRYQTLLETLPELPE